MIEEGSRLARGDSCKALLSFWSFLGTQWVVMVMLLLKNIRGGKRVKLEAKDRYNLQWNRLICTRGTGPGTRDNNTLGIRGNLRGTILGPGKKIVVSFKGTTLGLQ